MILTSFLKIILLLLTLLIGYFAASYFIKAANMKKIKQIVQNYNEKYEKRIVDAKIAELYKLQTKKSFLGKIDDLIYNSNIRKYIPILSSEIYLIFNIGFTLFIYIFAGNFTSSIVIIVTASIVVFVAPYMILDIMVQNNLDKIDDELLIYVNSLKNYARIKNSILFMMENTTKNLSEPLRLYNRTFTNEIKRGVTIKKAFDNYIGRISNIRLKNLLRNLYICSENNADYKKVLDKSRVIFQKYSETKEERRREVKSGQASILTIIVASLFVIWGLRGISSTLFYDLSTSLIGQIIIGYIFGVIGIAIYICYKLKKTNY